MWNEVIVVNFRPPLLHSKDWEKPWRI